MEMENIQVKLALIPEGWKGKRKRKSGSREKKIIAWRNCGLARACPAWVCEEQIEWMEIKAKIDVLTNDFEMISLEESKEEEMNTGEREKLG